MRAHDQAHSLAADVGQDEGAKGQVVGIDVTFGRECAVSGLCIRALDEPDRGLEGEEPEDIGRGPIQVRLQAHADAWMPSVKPVVKLERPVGVGAPLHVDPQETLDAAGRLRKPVQIRKSGLRIDVQAELGRLDRDLGLDPGGRRRVEHRLVVLDHLSSLGQGLDVLTEPGEDDADLLGFEIHGGLQRSLEVFAWYEALRGATDEAPLRDVARQPGVAGGPQEQPSHGPGGAALIDGIGTA